MVFKEGWRKFIVKIDELLLVFTTLCEALNGILNVFDGWWVIVGWVIASQEDKSIEKDWT